MCSVLLSPRGTLDYLYPESFLLMIELSHSTVTCMILRFNLR
ncbi:hypothetical protein AB205_0119810 [Aquarana catesbeiana]|uniref:Uncharacterized protein n=1 Tax=Aquarana catesbeiana TaxID=8400 RepID=A0A2G9RR10_AQUCT|nr:hypothetical protein AB205_0119810 [Aquarana catesbeiana]